MLLGFRLGRLASCLLCLPSRQPLLHRLRHRGSRQAGQHARPQPLHWHARMRLCRLQLVSRLSLPLVPFRPPHEQYHTGSKPQHHAQCTSIRPRRYASKCNSLNCVALATAAASKRARGHRGHHVTLWLRSLWQRTLMRAALAASSSAFALAFACLQHHTPCTTQHGRGPCSALALCMRFELGAAPCWQALWLSLLSLRNS